MASRWTTTLGAWVLAALTFGLAPAACIIAPEEVHGPCAKDTDCPDDGIPCTKESCDTTTGFCKRDAQDLPFGDTGCDDQNPCTDDVCKEGACAHNEASLPPTDGNECTDDTCVNGVATYTPVENGVGCGLGGMLKCTSGKCNCTSAEECGTSTECLKFACENSACSSTSLEKGTFVDGNDPGDCLKRVCDGANAAIVVPDVTDIPADPTTGNCQKKGCDDQGNVTDDPDPTDLPTDDNNPCTDEGCNGGMLIDHVPVSDGTPCGNGAKCEAVAGGGFQTTPHDACVTGACTGQSPVSCALYACNAAGDACLSTCGGAGDCIAGTYCDNATNLCTPLAAIGAPCANQGQCAMGTFCVDGYCCNTTCADTCQRCNVQNNEGVCSAVPNGQDPDGECPGQDACNGQGGCAKPNGSACAGPTDCLSGNCEDSVCCNVACAGACKACNLPNKVGVCSNVDANAQPAGCDTTKACDANGNCKNLNGQPCNSGFECVNGVCTDSTCCNSQCMGSCARCDLAGSVGTCMNVPAGQQVSNCNNTQACDGNNVCKKASGQTCNMPSECATGFCPSEVGQKFCCDAACTDNCLSCAGGKTTLGTNGICSFVKTNTDPNDNCAGTCNSGTNCCDGAGMCN